MFLGGVDRERGGIMSRAAGIGLGTIVMLAAAAALFSARTTAFTFPLCVAAFVTVAAVRRDLRATDVLPGRATWPLAAFLGFALLSVLWARNPGVPFEKATLSLLMLAGTLAVTALISREPYEDALHIGEGLCFGVAIGLAFLLVELRTGQSLKIAFFNALHFRPGELKPIGFFFWEGNRLIAMSADYMSRNITPAALLLWPTALVLRVIPQRALRICLSVGLVTLAALVIALSSHESSKLALVAGLAVFALTLLSRRWTYRVMVATWAVACLAAVPLALFAYQSHLHEATWLQDSARHRIIIWNETAEMTLASPIIGVGANMTYVLGPELEKEDPTFGTTILSRTLNIHSHNIYLQTWFELGVVGAVLLALAGLSVLGAIARLAPPLQPYAYATFASVAAMAAASYGMWQLWYIALFAFTAVAFAIGARLVSPAPPPHGRRSPGTL
jgi:O-antigen ligase